MAELVFATYDPAALAAATNNFDTAFFLGNGSFGQVYHAQLEGTSVAVKRMGTATRSAEVQTERMRQATLRHPRLLPCYGMVRAPGPSARGPWT